RKYVDATPIPRIGLALTNSGKSAIRESLDHIAAAVRGGGIISIDNGQLRANNGIRKSESAGKGSATATVALHALSINLPRLAYESNKDETYFRAKLALMIKPSLAAMSMRKKTIVDNIKRGLTPAITSGSQSMQRGGLNIVINLIGTKESVYNILGHEGPSGAEIIQKVLKTSADVVAMQGRQLGEDSSAGISMIADGSGLRFASLDSEKYGKVSLLQTQNTASYTQGMTLNGKTILSDGTAVQECISIDKLVNGGLATSVDITDLAQSEVIRALEAATELSYFRPRIAL